MIAFNSSTVFVNYEDGRMAPLDSERLTKSVADAAQVAGHGDWPVAEHVAAAVATFFECDWDQPNVHRHCLIEAVASVLEALHHDDIAKAYRQLHARVVVDLAALAKQTSSGFELEFFRLLGGRLDRVCAQKLPEVEFRNLRACVKILSGKHSWRTRCKRLGNEVLSFIRHKIMANVGKNVCSIVVNG